MHPIPTPLHTLLYWKQFHSALMLSQILHGRYKIFSTRTAYSALITAENALYVRAQKYRPRGSVPLGKARRRISDVPWVPRFHLFQVSR